MIQKTTLFITIALGLLFSGCSSTPKVRTKFVQQKHYNSENENNPREFRYQPVIGTQQADTRVMIDMGEWAKIWVKNYKNENKTFIASHSIVTMVREPGFISGEQVPRGRRDTVSKSYGSRSFSFRSQDLTYDNSSFGNEGVSDTEVKDYMNAFEYSKKTKRMEPQKRKNTLKHDEAIISYMKEVEKKKKVEKIAQHKAKVKAVLKQAELEKIAASETSDAQYESEDEYKNGGLK